MSKISPPSSKKSGFFRLLFPEQVPFSPNSRSFSARLELCRMPLSKTDIAIKSRIELRFFRDKFNDYAIENPKQVKASISVLEDVLRLDPDLFLSRFTRALYDICFKGSSIVFASFNGFYCLPASTAKFVWEGENHGQLFCFEKKGERLRAEAIGLYQRVIRGKKIVENQEKNLFGMRLVSAEGQNVGSIILQIDPSVNKGALIDFLSQSADLLHLSQIIAAERKQKNGNLVSIAIKNLFDHITAKAREWTGNK
ncbi:MAG: hypothetical protein HQ564_02005 [Candidatus Saganbacteria bacterium]|nr:hypothetical protein [Candidatus Saganbacteria bacterium]